MFDQGFSAPRTPGASVSDSLCLHLPQLCLQIMVAALVFSFYSSVSFVKLHFPYILCHIREAVNFIGRSCSWFVFIILLTCSHVPSCAMADSCALTFHSQASLDFAAHVNQPFPISAFCPRIFFIVCFLFHQLLLPSLLFSPF